MKDHDKSPKCPINPELVEFRIQGLEDKFDSFSKTILDKLESLHEEHNHSYTKDETDKNYASKNVERVVYGAILAILTYFLGGLLGLFTIPMVHAVYNLIT